MLKIHKDSNFKEAVNSNELYDGLGLAQNQYKRWCESTLMTYGTQSIDYYNFNTMLKLTATNPKRIIIYRLTINFAKELCMIARTPKGKEIRQWLISLSEQKENLDLLTHDQVVMLSVLKSFFRYVDNQKEVLKQHVQTYVDNNLSKNPYADFHIWRNEILGIEKEVLDAKIKQYCIENSKRLPKLTTSHDKIRFLNEYDSLKNAVWDFLNIKGEINAMKLAELVKRMAQAENMVIFQHNEDNLFQSKENINIKQLKQ